MKARPTVPRKDEAPVYGIQSNKNFITTNAVEVILSKPKKVPQEEFNWTRRPGFGTVPVYLKRNKARVQEEKEQFETYLRMRREPVSERAASISTHAEAQTRSMLIRVIWCICKRKRVPRKVRVPRKSKAYSPYGTHAPLTLRYASMKTCAHAEQRICTTYHQRRLTTTSHAIVLSHSAPQR